MAAVVHPFSPQWIDGASALRDRFQHANPFPHLVLDDFLDPAFADALLAEFPAVDAMPKSRDYVFGNKRELSSVEEAGPAGAAYHRALLSEQFQAFLLKATAFDLIVDPTFFGGGFHQGGDGSFLDMHVDFNVHPSNPQWLRTINVLLYLNKDWREDYRGELLVKASVGEQPVEIAPLFNRCVIMLTDDHTYHGYDRMSLPPGVTRKSIAAYAYRVIDAGEVAPRTTSWAPEDAGVIKQFMARHYGGAVRTKNRFFGSRTARNR